jgi:prepilin-type N-terminal cleavage/methylation domain-containing protein
MKQPYAFHFGVGTCRGEMREVQGGSALSTFHLSLSTSARQSRRAFTLVELMGVMAIIGILAAVTLPSMISRIEDANSMGEDAKLEEIARALVAGIKATGTIPNPTTPNFNAGSWTAIALNYTTLGQTALATVLPAGNARQIVLSANLAAYVAANGYTAPANGWPDPLPNDLKIYILASSKDGLPLLGGIPVADIANWTKVFGATTGTVAVPVSVFGAAYTTKGEFLHVKTIDVRSLFCAVALTDFPIPTGGQTTASGSGFTPNTPYQGQAAGCSFNFTAPATVGAVVVGFETDPSTAATGVAVGSKTMIPRTGATTTGLMGVIPPPDRNIASLNARNTLASNLLTGPYAEAAGAPDATNAVAAISDANINTLVNSTVPAPAGLTTVQNTYNTSKATSDAAKAAADAENIRDPGNATAPDNSTLESTAATALQATASALDALQTAQDAARAQSTANANALAAASANAISAAYTEFRSGGTPQSIASAAANAAANAAAAQVVTSPAIFSMNIDQPPWWSIGTLAGQQMPSVGNNQIFYVIKGTALTLYAAGAALPADPILTVQINTDSKFEYFNGSWTRVD